MSSKDSNNSGEKTVVISGESPTLKTERESIKDAAACLIVIRGTPQGKRFELNKSNLFIGRDPSAEISLADQNASRKHAELIVEGSKVRLRDNGSTNGTFINDKQISGTVELKKEDMIKVGNTILKFLPAGELEIFYIGTLEQAAHTDPLTKLYNKGYLNESLEAEFKRAKALHHDLSLMVLDLDFFKKINDTHGHDAGDYVLKEVASILKTKFNPKTSVLGRYGGEEFVLILPNQNLESAQNLGESLRTALEKHSFVYDSKKLTVTASIGVAELAVDVDSGTALFKLADKAVYEAKSSGRNKVCSAR